MNPGSSSPACGALAGRRPVIASVAMVLAVGCGGAERSSTPPDGTISDDGRVITVEGADGDARYVPGAIPDALAALPRPDGATSEAGFGFEAPGVRSAAMTVPLSPAEVLAFYETALPASGYCPDARALGEHGGSLVARGELGTVTVIVREAMGGGSSLVLGHMDPPGVTAPPPRDAS